MNDLAIAAVEYAALHGWSVIPCTPGGKEPLVAHGFNGATTDLEAINRWWARWPEANVAIRTGDQLVVLDADGDEGVQALERLESAHTPIRGPRVGTGGGGVHVYMAAPLGGLKTRVRWAEHLDLKGTGGYVIAPPSIHRSGRPYAWMVDRFVGMQLPPTWLLERLAPPTSPTRRAMVLRLPATKRDALRRSAEATLSHEVRRIAFAAVGTRNETTNRTAFRLGRLVAVGVLDEREVASVLIGAALHAGLPESEARRTVASGLSAAQRLEHGGHG